MIASGAISYLVMPDEMAKEVTALGFPAYLVYFIALAKIAGITAIWAKKSGSIVEWAYAGLFFELLIVAFAYLNMDPVNVGGPLFGIALLFVSYFMGKKQAG